MHTHHTLIYIMFLGTKNTFQNKVFIQSEITQKIKKYLEMDGNERAIYQTC